MAQPVNAAAAPNQASLEKQVRDRVESLTYLPTTVAVAMKFIELGEDPDAEPNDYAKVISADSSLCAKILSLANSSWFGVRNKITKPVMAVNLLGLSTVRTLAISYCLAGLHGELDLTPEESKLFWNASLCKAVAAKRLVTAVDKKHADEAFAAALLQDFAMPVMYCVAKDTVLGWLQDCNLDWRTRLEREKETFRLDHSELGRLVAQKLDLPEFYIDAIAFHHDHAKLAETLPANPIIQGLRLASVFPHCLNSWNISDAQEVQEPLRGSHLHCANTEDFLGDIQKEFDQLCAFFEPVPGQQIVLKDMLKMATKAAADSTTRLVGTVHELMQQAIQAGKQVDQILQEHSRLEEAVQRDALTGALNREGLHAKASPLLRKAGRYGNGFAVVYFDLDHFKNLNDTRGHDWGDAALRTVVESLRAHLRETDLIARMGGDEFVVLLNDCGQENALSVMERVVQSLRDKQADRDHPTAPRVTLSIGFLWAQPDSQEIDLDALITHADRLMYTAKRAGGNRVCKDTLTSAGTTGPAIIKQPHQPAAPGHAVRPAATYEVPVLAPAGRNP